MACSSMITLSRPTLSPSPSSSSTASSFLPPNPLCHVTTLRRFRTFRSKSLSSSKKQLSVSASASLQALVFDCDGVILESEHLHRQAYNDSFAHFNVRCPSSSSSDESQQPLNWGIDFYDQLQNRIGGGKPKMRWFSLLSSLFLFIFTFFFSLIVDWLGFAIVSEGTLGSTVGRFQRYSRSLPRPMRTESS